MAISSLQSNIKLRGSSMVEQLAVGRQLSVGKRIENFGISVNPSTDSGQTPNSHGNTEGTT